MNTTQLQSAFEFVSHAAAKSDVRYYLNGVHIKSDGKGTLTLTATDGHRLAQITVDCDCPELERIITNESVKLAIASLKAGIMPALLELPETGGIYPDVDRVIPKEPVSADSIGLNAKYVQQGMAAALKVANKKYSGVRLDMNGNNGCIKFSIANEWLDSPAIIVIMPMRL